MINMRYRELIISSKVKPRLGCGGKVWKQKPWMYEWLQGFLHHLSVMFLFFKNCTTHFPQMWWNPIARYIRHFSSFHKKYIYLVWLGRLISSKMIYKCFSSFLTQMYSIFYIVSSIHIQVYAHFPASSVVKNSPAMQEPQETQVQFLGQEDPLEKVMETHSSILTLRTPWTKEPGGLQSMGLQRVRHGWATKLNW